ncbi:hypothetical protein LXA43DRAFT_839945, partial [Ganoderma leucocontextum]
MEPFIVAVFVLASVLHSVAATSRSCSAFVLAAVEAILFGAMVWCNAKAGTEAGKNGLTPTQVETLNDIPDDIRGVLSFLGLEPDIVHYACC